ncbi:jg15870, partial [Pararge aegeria aegeria]
KDDPKMDESIYSVVAEEAEEAEEEAPPPPPPRAESLTRAPARPLPNIPTSASLGNLNYNCTAESSSSDEGDPPTPPSRECPTPSSSGDEEYDDPASVNER